jgi:hypothetical protein
MGLGVVGSCFSFVRVGGSDIAGCIVWFGVGWLASCAIHSLLRLFSFSSFLQLGSGACLCSCPRCNVMAWIFCWNVCSVSVGLWNTAMHSIYHVMGKELGSAEGA